MEHKRLRTFLSKLKRDGIITDYMCHVSYTTMAVILNLFCREKESREKERALCVRPLYTVQKMWLKSGYLIDNRYV